jgi:hypothetical protein
MIKINYEAMEDEEMTDKEIDENNLNFLVNCPWDILERYFDDVDVSQKEEAIYLLRNRILELENNTLH